jgi:phospholipid-binding lipoprotein MlaA
MSVIHIQRSFFSKAIGAIKAPLAVIGIIGIFSTGCAHNAVKAHLWERVQASTEAGQPSRVTKAPKSRTTLKKKIPVASNSDATQPAPAESDALESDGLYDDDLDLIEDLDDEAAPAVSDPLYRWNLAMFKFNDKLYYWALQPIARGYKAVVPWEIRHCIRNFFHNILFPVRFANCLLQGKLQNAGAEFGRFFINSTVGLLGLADIAKLYPGLNPPEEDLGQTLAVWGIGNGPYLYWPILGPATLRDTLGLVGDIFLNPLFYNLGQPLETSIAASGLRYLNETSYRIGDYEALKESALEPYEAFRNFYIRYRENKIRE